MIRCYRCGEEKEPCLFCPSRIPQNAAKLSDVVCRKCVAERYGHKFGDQVRLSSRIAGRKLLRFEKAKEAEKKQAQRAEIKRLKAMREERLKKMAEQE